MRNRKARRQAFLRWLRRNWPAKGVRIFWHDNADTLTTAHYQFGPRATHRVKRQIHVATAKIPDVAALETLAHEWRHVRQLDCGKTPDEADAEDFAKRAIDSYLLTLTVNEHRRLMSQKPKKGTFRTFIVEGN